MHFREERWVNFLKMVGLSVCPHPSNDPTAQMAKLEEDIERNKYDFIGLMHLAEALQRVGASNIYSMMCVFCCMLDNFVTSLDEIWGG